MEYTFDPDLLDVLVCPLTRTPLKLTEDGSCLISEKAHLKYPIRDGMPILLPDQAILPEDCASLDEYKAKYKDLIPE